MFKMKSKIQLSVVKIKSRITREKSRPVHMENISKNYDPCPLFALLHIFAKANKSLCLMYYSIGLVNNVFHVKNDEIRRNFQIIWGI